ncbi:MAG: hypothetical protein QXN35_06950 [Ignisphaera sp.]
MARKRVGWIEYDEEDIVFHDDTTDEDVIVYNELIGLIDVPSEVVQAVEQGDLEIWLWVKTGKFQIVKKS